MGQMFSRENDVEQYPVTITQLAIKKVANKPPPAKLKCSTPNACDIEKIEIDGLKKLKDMEEKFAKEKPLTTEEFDAAWDSIKENKCINFNKAPLVFTEERAALSDAYETGKPDKVKIAAAEYKKAVEDRVEEISRKAAKEIAREDKQPPEPDPKKKKK